MQYAGMAFQMLTLIGIGAFVGWKLDQRFAHERPVLAAAGAFLFLLFAFYLTLKDLIRPPKQ
ncbi:MAG: AtpZ/AtpI family protein [Bacteroidetes bacterium]|nr:MAG: AtpZ/AtpI family protein [Bacteroidota bacterium]